jgi:hypothetical protein
LKVLAKKLKNSNETFHSPTTQLREAISYLSLPNVEENPLPHNSKLSPTLLVGDSTFGKVRVHERNLAGNNPTQPPATTSIKKKKMKKVGLKRQHGDFKLNY